MTRTVATLLMLVLMIPASAFAQLAVTPPPSHERVGWDARLSQTVLARGASNQVYVDITLTPEERIATSRVPMNIALVIDKSGSMASAGKIDYARQAAQSIIDQLEPYDRVAIVTFDSNIQLVQASTLVTDREAIKRLIGNIRTGSNTALHGGMTRGASEVRAHRNAEFLNRVIVLSDGKANVGPSSNDELARAARALGDEGISVTAMGLGVDYNEDAMTAIADASGGNYYFIESADQMAYQFQQELYGMMQVAALQSTLTITVAPGVTVRDIYGYDFTQEGRQARVRIGDLVGGRSLHITALLDVNAGSADRMALGTVYLGYTDAVDGREVALTQGLVAELSEREEDQLASRDDDVAVRAQEVHNAEAVATAMDAFAAGNDDEAKAIVERARRETESMAAGMGAAAAAPAAAMGDELDAVLMDMEEAEADSAARGAVVKSKKAGARSSSRGE